MRETRSESAGGGRRPRAPRPRGGGGGAMPAGAWPCRSSSSRGVPFAVLNAGLAGEAAGDEGDQVRIGGDVPQTEAAAPGDGGGQRDDVGQRPVECARVAPGPAALVVAVDV